MNEWQKQTGSGCWIPHTIWSTSTLAAIIPHTLYSLLIDIPASLATSVFPFSFSSFFLHSETQAIRKGGRSWGRGGKGREGAKQEGRKVGGKREGEGRKEGKGQ